MALTIYTIISWLIIMFVTLLPRKLSLIENSFIFLVMSILIKNSFTFIGLNLKWIESNQEPEYFLAYLLYRTIIYPLAFVLMMNLLVASKKALTKWLITLATVAFILFIENLGVWLNVYTYKQWNNWYTVAEIALFSVIALFITKFITQSYKRTKSHESI